jgi:hypothetical protein
MWFYLCQPFVESHEFTKLTFKGTKKKKMPERYLTLDLFVPKNDWKVHNSCYISQTSFCMLSYK